MAFKYKIYGERNCGTNLLRALLADQHLLPDDVGITRVAAVNSVALLLGRVAPRVYDTIYDHLALERLERVLRWKHAVPSSARLLAAGVTPIVIVKHPSFWMRSFTKRPFHHYAPSTLYRPRRIERMRRTSVDLQELIFVKYTAYKEVLSDCGGILVQYETLVTHFAESQQRLRDLVGTCRDLPDGDVRSFVEDGRENPRGDHSNDALQRLDVISTHWWKNASELLSRFGYGVREWRKTLPSSL